MFNANIDAAHARGRWQILLVHSITPTDQLWYNPVAITDVTASMAYGQAAHAAYDAPYRRFGRLYPALRDARST